MKSPITGKENVVYDSSFDPKLITRLYKERLDIDVSRFLNAVDEIKVYKCQETGLRYFWPRTLDGDGKFYEDLERFDWYYMHDKWEHRQTLELIAPGMKVLEIGCAEGHFMQRIIAKGAEAVGLELNEKATQLAKDKGLNVERAFVQDYAEQFAGTFDLVCHFHVLEHIADVDSFMKASVKLLKPGGLLVVAVPNNDSFLGYDRNNILNVPPHHTNLWNDESLRKLGGYYQLDWIGHELEDVQPQHSEYLFRVLKNTAAVKMGIWPRILFMLFRNTIQQYLASHITMFKGFTILSKYKKL